jgi:hypothetical protein
MKALITILAAVLLVGCSCEKKVARFNESTLKKQHKLLRKGCAQVGTDSIPTKILTPDTLYSHIEIPGPVIIDTFRIECDENNRPVINGQRLSTNIYRREVKCPDIDSTIALYNADKVAESNRADFCCAALKQCQERQIELVQSEVCGFWCKAKIAGMGIAIGAIAAWLLIVFKSIILKTL